MTGTWRGQITGWRHPAISLEKQGIPHLRQQITVLHSLPRLHYPDNSCLNLILPVFIQFLASVLLVMVRFALFGRHYTVRHKSEKRAAAAAAAEEHYHTFSLWKMKPTGLYFNSMQFGGKTIVDSEIVVAFHVLGLWLLVQNSLARLPTGKRLQGSDQVLLGYLRLFLDLL